ncbi:MAG: site-specific DNA-methyltransferase [Planctomycetes bacterium]|nr:site-specific DNA-methyltransferase [Planctomycetota bacterium]
MKRPKSCALRNKTITLTKTEKTKYTGRLLRLSDRAGVPFLANRVINQDIFKAHQFLPDKFVDLLFIDPPYNMHKTFNTGRFSEMAPADYADWMDSWLAGLVRVLKPTASIYICGDWRSSGAIQQVAGKYFKIRNRVTWEREKGRGAKGNWKNNSEDIWFCTMSDEYVFNVDAVKLKRRVIAPYTDEKGRPKDWEKTEEGAYRLTHPSNIWTDITVPFWSMAENTKHPTQKPEKLLAKIILASTRAGDFVLDPFAGSGTALVVAKKLNRRFLGIEIDSEYASLALKRLEMAEKDKAVQGYADGVFWERNAAVTR